jgi:hypothetical protein
MGLQRRYGAWVIPDEFFEPAPAVLYLPAPISRLMRSSLALALASRAFFEPCRADRHAAPATRGGKKGEQNVRPHGICKGD